MSAPYPGFREVPSPSFAQRAFRSRDGGLVVLLSEDVVAGKRWLHVSVSRRSRTPTYEDLAQVKAAFVGELLPAYQVFPRATEHRNFHPNCLHLWVPLEGDPFPDPLGERADTVAPAELSR